ncbi:MAG: DUF2807 domain-containing protein [Pseudomonadota bacterium]|nr:DUF2807 domain-containing protein [Pseudomonadota bacterium]
MHVLALLAAVPLAACSFHTADHDSAPGIKGQGAGTARTCQVAGFSGVSLRGSDDVDVRTGTGFSVRAEGPAAELDKLKIVKEGDTLRVGRIDGTGIHWGSTRDAGKVTIYVTMPRITAANIAGSGDMSVDTADGASFTSDNAGSGALTIGTLTVDNAAFSLAGSGDVTVKGSAKHLKVVVAGSGNLDGSALKADNADVSVAGSGDVKAAVSGPASVSVLGSGDVDLGAAAKCSISKLGSGSVRCGATPG